MSSLILISCATQTYRTSGFDYSTEDIQRAISDSIPQGVAAASQNRRGLYSHIFNQDEKKNKVPLVMLITILGEQRPYDLDVAVRRVDPRITNVIEAFDQGETFVGQDSLAKRTVSKINGELVKRRKDRNMFDDFRPF